MKGCKLLLLVMALIGMRCSDSCTKEELFFKLHLDRSVIADTTFYIDRVSIHYPTCDSFLISKVMNQGFVSVSIYTIDSNSNMVFENKILKGFDRQILGTEKILAFARKDTSNIFRLNLDKYPPVYPKGTEDFRYAIVALSDNEFFTTRENLMDTIFRDIIYYDSSFKVKKIVIRDKKNSYYFMAQID